MPSAVEVISGYLLHGEIAFRPEGNFDDSRLFRDESRQPYVAQHEQVVDDALGVASLNFEVLVVLFSQHDEAGAVLIEYLHAVGNAVAQ